MFGRGSKIKRAIAKSVEAATNGAGTLSFEPIEGLRDGEKVDAYVDLGHQLIFHEELATAEAAIDRAVQLAPRELYVLDAKAEVCVEAGRYEDALSVYQTMYELAPHEPAVVLGLAQLMLSTHAADAAVALLEKHASWNFPQTQQCLGEALFAAGQSAKALELLEQVHDHYTAALKQASFVDNFQELRHALEAATRLRDDVFAEVHGREATIEKHARTASLDGRAGVNYRLLGQSLAASSDHVPDVTVLEPIPRTLERAMARLEVHADDPVGLALQGTAQLREGALELARASFEAATAADGRFFAGFLGLGAVMDCETESWFRKARALPEVETAPWLEAVVPDWPTLSEPERRVVWASVRPVAAVMPTLQAAGSTIRILPIDVRPVDLAEFSDASGQRFEDDHRVMDALDGVATHGIAVAKIETLLATTGSSALTFAHELAHLVFFALDDVRREQVIELYAQAIHAGYAVTEYQQNNPDELFAVAYTDFLRDKYDLGWSDEGDETGVTEALFDVIAGLATPDQAGGGPDVRE